MTYYEELARIKKEYYENSQNTLLELRKLRQECEKSNAFFTKKDIEKQCHIVVKALAETL